MGIQEAELRVQRIMTDKFIQADSVEVTLYRSARSADGAGGYTDASPAPLPPQVMRLIPLRDGAEEQLTADGQKVRPTYMLMGRHDADMQRWDTFTTEDGTRYEVVFVNANRQYQVKGEVAYRG